MSDPRGPLRTVSAVETTPSEHVVTFSECGHTAHWTRHNSARVGDTGHCLTCLDTAQDRVRNAVWTAATESLKREEANMEVRPMFGAHALQPDGLSAVYGGRWIVQQDGYTDLVPGRHGTEGVGLDDGALLRWLNDDGALAAARTAASDLLAKGIINTRKASPIVLFQDKRGAIVADTNASAGYLYVTGWLFDDLPADSATRGLDKVLDSMKGAL